MTKLAKQTEADKPHLVPVTSCLLIVRESSWVLAQRVKRDLAEAQFSFLFLSEIQRDGRSSSREGVRAEKQTWRNHLVAPRKLSTSATKTLSSSRAGQA